MAIAPSRLGEFVAQEGFSWPTNHATTRDFSTADDALVRRLRDADLVRRDATDDEVAATFHEARREHAAGGYSPFNSPNERVRVFLAPYLTPKGQRWAVPLASHAFTDGDSGPTDVTRRPLEAFDSSGADARRDAQAWWKFWTRRRKLGHVPPR